MSWSRILELIEEEVGADLAKRIEDRIRRELAGERITVCARVALTAKQVDAAAPGRPREAARRLKIHPTTAYRALKRKPTIR